MLYLPPLPVSPCSFEPLNGLTASVWPTSRDFLSDLSQLKAQALELVSERVALVVADEGLRNRNFAQTLCAPWLKGLQKCCKTRRFGAFARIATIVV